MIVTVMELIISGTCECYANYAVGQTGVCDAHAPETGICAGTTCLNGGTCTERENLLTSIVEPICACVSGWMGDDCGTGALWHPHGCC